MSRSADGNLTASQIVKIGTRGSVLARWQATHVAERLQQLGLQTEIVVIKTTGDRVQDRMLHEIGGKGLFVREIESALLDRRVDIAVHSLKDLPVRTPPDLLLAAFLPRHSPFDVLVVGADTAVPQDWQKGELQPRDLSRMPELVIGTGSLRRTTLLLGAQRSIPVHPLRGNIDTRLGKVADGSLGGIVLAQAALDRSGLGQPFQCFLLEPSWFVPSASQGVMVVETRQGDAFSDFARQLNCSTTEKAVAIERGVLERLGGDCTMPVGVYARLDPDRDGWLVDAMVGLDGDNIYGSSAAASMEDSSTIAGRLFRELQSAGVQKILDKLATR